MPAGRAGPDTPGWYPDPTHRFHERFWLRGRWTGRVRYRGAEAVDPCDVEAPLPAPRQGPGERGGGQGWRDDPTGRFEQRWWDGHRYTRRVRVGEAVATDAGCAPRTTRRDRRRHRRRQGTDAADLPGWYPDPDGDGERFWDGYVWSAKWRPAPPRGQRHSMRGWMPRTVMRALVLVLLVVLVVVVVAVVAWLT